jgi:hypothetical protein
MMHKNWIFAWRATIILNIMVLALIKTLSLFVVTALAEIIGCYLPYLWLKQDKPAWEKQCGNCEPDLKFVFHLYSLSSIPSVILTFRKSTALAINEGVVKSRRKSPVKDAKIIYSTLQKRVGHPMVN